MPTTDDHPQAVRMLQRAADLVADGTLTVNIKPGRYRLLSTLRLNSNQPKQGDVAEVAQRRWWR